MKADATKITDGVYWVGVLDWDLRDYHGYSLDGTTYNCYLVFGEDKVALIADDEAKLKSDTQWNRMLPETGDVIKGTFFIAGLGKEDFTDLSSELTEKYKQRFWNIELFIPTPNGLMPIVIRE